MNQCPKCGFKEVKKIYLDGFETFWTSYPRKVGKGLARKVWSKIKPDGLMLGEMLVALEAQKETTGWKAESGIYIPHPSTWLNGERWLDETQKQKAPPPKFDPEKMAQKEREMDELKERLYKRRVGEPI